jgi:hypothetical protein
MMNAPRTSRFCLGCLAILALVLSACSSAVEGPGGRISKVNYYHLMSNYYPQTVTPLVLFEYQRHLHGAVTAADYVEKYGHYYTVFWKANDRDAGPVTVRFEYMQALSGLKKRTQEQIVDDIRRSNISKFQVTGEEYKKSGRVTAWRVSVLRGKEELVSQQSALWN